jgi:hypothetical protein
LVHHRRKAPLLFDLLVLRIVGTNVGLRYAYPTYKTDTPPALSLRQIAARLFRHFGLHPF